MPTCAREERYEIGRGKALDFDALKGTAYYYLNNVGRLYDRTYTEYLINAAFAEWNKHLHPLQLLPTGDKKMAYIQIYFSGIQPMWSWLVDLLPSMRRFFSIEPIPMENTTYAYGFEAFHTKYGGHIYINNDISWRENAIALTKVIVHEMGHVLNIRHTQEYNTKDIMLPEYDFYHIITSDTIAAVEFLYGDTRKKYLPLNT